MNSNETPQPFGVTSAPSTSKKVNIVALIGSGEISSVIGKLAYFDTTIDGEVYRAIGTIADVETVNALSGTSSMEMAAARGSSNLNNSSDVRKTTLVVQAVFVQRNAEWLQYGSALPNSPSTGSLVALINEFVLGIMLANTAYPSIGRFRGLDTPLPLLLPDFASNRGAFHTAILGKSGSGKTALATYVLAAEMRHEHHGILVIDPQGQWSNENGFLFSVQAFAENLGREVSVLRVSEDIRLPMSEEMLGKMIDKIDLLGKGFKRMGNENKEALAYEIASRIAAKNRLDEDAKVVLEKVFADIAQSNSALSRIYASQDRRELLRDQLRLLAGLGPLPDEDGIAPIVTAEEEEEVEVMWVKMLSRFRPIHSLFSKKNFAGNNRRPLGGDSGFLNDVLQVRNSKSKPAPYVIFDMSPNINLHQKLALDKDAEGEMQRLLDNEEIKAIILASLLDEIKKSSEIAFSESGGNLNTQIVFDEAWRYAPEKSSVEEINVLSTMLAGFARDTRKFGIGWTYILQSPGDLRNDIWKQLTFTYSGYGLVGEDVKRLESLVDDSAQVDLYRQFISPASTGIYPFMITGPISPLIFTASPTFLNAYSDYGDFVEHNSRWIREITTRRSMKMVTEDAIAVRKKARKTPDEEEVKTFGVGKLKKRPQSQTGVYAASPTDKTADTVTVAPNGLKVNDVVSDFPF